MTLVHIVFADGCKDVHLMPNFRVWMRAVETGKPMVFLVGENVYVIAMKRYVSWIMIQIPWLNMNLHTHFNFVMYAFYLKLMALHDSQNYACFYMLIENAEFWKLCSKVHFPQLLGNEICQTLHEVPFHCWFQVSLGSRYHCGTTWVSDASYQHHISVMWCCSYI